MKVSIKFHPKHAGKEGVLVETRGMEKDVEIDGEIITFMNYQVVSLKTIAAEKEAKAKREAHAKAVEALPAPDPLPGQSMEEYYDSDAYYNWKHRMDDPEKHVVHDANLPPKRGGHG